MGAIAAGCAAFRTCGERAERRSTGITIAAGIAAAAPVEEEAVDGRASA